MSLRRSKKHRLDSEEIDITSLLDILVILLVFLLKSYNDSDLSVDLVNELALPYSTSLEIPRHGVVLQVNKRREVFIDNKLQGRLKSNKTFNKVEKYLTKEFKAIKLKTTKKAQKKKDEDDGEMINLVFDKNLTYVEINKVMGLAAETGFSKYKLVIQGLE